MSKKGVRNDSEPRPWREPEIRLEDFYAQGVMIGLLAAQAEQPPREWATTLALEWGEAMAREARRRRRPR